MLEKDPFHAWLNSPYYHLLYHHERPTKTGHLIPHLINHLQPKNGSKILHIGCGKGRHTRQMAEMGYDVTGIDFSFEAIEEAKESENETLHFFQHDIRLPFWMQYFNYAFNLFTSFGYFKTSREHNNAIRTIARSLTTDGVLVLDYINVQYGEDNLQKSEDKTVDGIRFKISHTQDANNFFKEIQVEDKAGNEQLFTEKTAKFGLEDFSEMFSRYGLQTSQVFGNYELVKYNILSSPRLIMVATKATS